MLILTKVWLLKEVDFTNATGAGRQTKQIMTLSAYIKSTLFSEYGHVLYQIKRE